MKKTIKKVLIEKGVVDGPRFTDHEANEIVREYVPARDPGLRFGQGSGRWIDLIRDLEEQPEGTVMVVSPGDGDYDSIRSGVRCAGRKRGWIVRVKKAKTQGAMYVKIDGKAEPYPSQVRSRR
jgi:hypothetical protein